MSVRWSARSHPVFCWADCLTLLLGVVYRSCADWSPSICSAGWQAQPHLFRCLLLEAPPSHQRREEAPNAAVLMFPQQQLQPFLLTAASVAPVAGAAFPQLPCRSHQHLCLRGAGWKNRRRRRKSTGRTKWSCSAPPVAQRDGGERSAWNKRPTNECGGRGMRRTDLGPAAHAAILDRVEELFQKQLEQSREEAAQQEQARQLSHQRILAQVEQLLRSSTPSPPAATAAAATTAAAGRSSGTRQTKLG